MLLPKIRSFQCEGDYEWNCPTNCNCFESIVDYVNNEKGRTVVSQASDARTIQAKFLTNVDLPFQMSFTSTDFLTSCKNRFSPNKNLDKEKVISVNNNITSSSSSTNRYRDRNNVPADMHSTTVLADLSYSQIGQIDSFSFCRYSNLVYLNLSNNLISNIDDIAFYRLKKLEVLDLSNNLLIDFPRDPLLYANSIKYLNVRNNQLKELPEYFGLYSSGSLEVLDLGQSKNITRISTRAFQNLKNVKYLYLDRCRITDIPSLAGLQAIRRINLAYNRIYKIYSYNFQDLLLLDTLDLSYNPISEIQENAFYGLESLRILSLANTNLKTIENVIFGKNQYLKRVELNNNAWDCNCKNRWLVDWIKENLRECTVDNYSRYDKSPAYCPICDLPAQITGHTIDMLLTVSDCSKTVTSNSLYIDTSTLKPMTKDTQIINTKMGKKITLKCSNNSITPQTANAPNNENLIWVKNNKAIESNNENLKIKISVNGDLEINSVDVGDAGQYSCIRNSTKGFDSLPYFVNVTDAPLSSKFSTVRTTTIRTDFVEGIGGISRQEVKQINLGQVSIVVI